ncbi:hypothetical protein [Actomonas aquatica]|uniref:Glycine zipper 2TM domain-containing protein n=1 Tax=Actomonas aquatica TaxID=2866162 RepID=A0ABZ1C9I8_9BACT|nr:hypothetical protein [Opitutus sp. WL0086]WRQ88361.1 hypothetical protein K1X11_003025 [Opitutus sp. WL0086]
MKSIVVSLAVLSAVLSTGCTLPSSQPMVDRAQVGVVQTLDLGKVVRVRNVVIDGERTILGLSGGGSLGAAATYPGAGAGAGDYVVQAAAGIVGAVAGSAVEEAATRKPAQELTILLDSGSTVILVQETEDGVFKEGDRVQVNSGGWGQATVRIAIN